MIPAEQIDDVKRLPDVVAFIEASGIKLRRQGSSYVGLCPFHQDTTGSMAVSPEKQYWCCHGACSAGGKVIDYLPTKLIPVPALQAWAATRDLPKWRGGEFRKWMKTRRK